MGEDLQHKKVNRTVQFSLFALDCESSQAQTVQYGTIFYMNTATPNFRDQRRERILQTARDVFYEVGYAGASMSLISARLGGSKATLYAYFASKEELFEAIIREQCGEFAAVLQARIGSDDLRTTLTEIAHELMRVVMSDRAIRTIQLVIEESHRNPGLARLFASVMESQGKSSLELLLQTAHNKGQIHAPDIGEATRILKALMFGDCHFKRLLGLAPEPSDETISRQIDRAVDVFMAYYGTAAKVVENP